MLDGAEASTNQVIKYISFYLNIICGGSLPYADTDFFIALMDENDRLNKWARDAYREYRGRIFTSLAVVLELLLVTRRLSVPAKEVIDQLLNTAVVTGVDAIKVLLAAEYIDKQKLGVFDAFHAALCDGEIISSDHAYDRLEIRRIAPRS